VDPTDPNHDADIRIGSEAPKRRLPNLFPGMKAMGGLRATATSDRAWQIVAYKRPVRQNLSFRFSYCMRCFAVAYAADLNWKPLGTKPVFT
jgi:hypothetical protein